MVRYKNQILYGCQDPECRAPTCASFRKRVTDGPYRRYTELSARTLACYLASLDNAESGLCRNHPKGPFAFSPFVGPRRSGRQSRASGSMGGTGDTDKNDLVDRVKSPSAAEGGGNNSTDMVYTQPNNEGDLNDTYSAHKMKDPKSFTQNLFDTLSLRMVEWLPPSRCPNNYESDPYRRRNSRVASRQSLSSESPHNSDHTDTPKDTAKPVALSNMPEKGAPKNPITPSSRTIDWQPLPRLKHLSLTELDSWRKSPSSTVEDKSRVERKQPARSIPVNARPDVEELVSLPSPPAPKHRQQKHPGKTTDANHRNPQRKQRRVSWDGSKILNGAHCPEAERPGQVSPDPQVANMRSTHEPKLGEEELGQQYSHSETVQTVSHLSHDIVEGLSRIMIESDDEALRWREELSSMELHGSFDFSDWQFATSRQRQVFSFVAQAVFYVLGNSRQVLQSFRKDSGDGKSKMMNPRLDLRQLQSSFRRIFDICPRDIVLQSLWGALEKLFVPPGEVSSTVKRSSRRPSRNSSVSSPASIPVSPRWGFESLADEHVSDDNAAYVATVTLFALVGSLPKVDRQTWRDILQMRSVGTLGPDAEMRKLSSAECQLIVRVTDRLEHELALRLVGRFVRSLTARLAFHEIRKTRQAYQRRRSVLDLILENLCEHRNLTTADDDDDGASRDESLEPSAIIVEWLRTLLLREWNGAPEMARSSATGGAVQILASMYKERNRLGLVPQDFHTPFLSERLDPMEMPIRCLNRVPNNKTIHLLSYPFLFPPSALVTYFRAVNHWTMNKYYEAAMTATRHFTQTAFGAIQVNDDVRVLTRMKTSMSTYLILVVSRDQVLPDALNQLWRRERRELMRPLKVQMGMDEGEQGLDHGGVQQEFFRVALAEALSPSYGTFTTDNRTRISWFQPCSLEPLYKFELLGLLLSLAVYNGLTLPINFPTALYRKLLGLKVKYLDHIRDGWPDLARGLDELVKWKEGDVGDIFLRTYEFSFEALGRVHTVDMRRVGRDSVWPAPSASGSTNVAADLTVSDGAVHEKIQPEEVEADLVTNKNRHEFVKDYIFWLTDKSVRPQYEALARGFYTCLDRTALSIFTPEALKSVVEGIQEIDIAELERHARYEGGFGPTHRVVEDFWSVVRCYSAEKRARLLEFVTASDRIPVNGISSIMFVIQKNGVGDAVSFGFPLLFVGIILLILGSVFLQV